MAKELRCNPLQQGKEDQEYQRGEENTARQASKDFKRKIDEAEGSDSDDFDRFRAKRALEGNFRFVLDKSDLKSASDKKFVRKATVALKNKICEQNTTPCCERLVI